MKQESERRGGREGGKERERSGEKGKIGRASCRERV